MKLRIINDTHLGASRKAGTTPATQGRLRAYLQEGFASLLPNEDCHLVILGDLFDSFEVEGSELIAAYNTLSDWLGVGRRLTLVAGNHDWSPRAGKISSFHMLAHFLNQTRLNVELIDHTTGFTHVYVDHYAIPHMPNQELFDMEIDKAVKRGGAGYLLLHCNIMNPYAEGSDHSLGLSEEQVDDLIFAGWKIISGHEHQFSTRRNGNVLVPGNQVISSIADCLNNNAKHLVEIEDGVATVKTLYNISDVFAEVDWQADELPTTRFIRVTGHATADQAAEVVGRVAKWRQASDALILSNAVKVEGLADFESLAEASFDDVSKVDVLSLLLEELTVEEGQTVKELLSC